MTAPAAPAALSLDAAADLVRKSRLVPEDRLAELLPDVAEGHALLHRLCALGLLSRFQATQIARGKWRGFLLGTHYRLLEPLGKGGMGTVYLAEHTAMRRKVAVKVLAPELAADATALARFTREARAAARLVHPNVVHTIDIDPDSQPPFLVLEYVDGLTLQAAVADTGTFTAETAAFCGVQALTGLQKAHELGLVHRDIKPANVIVDRKGCVKLLDLGIVRFTSAKAAGLTMAGGKGKVILGTADYLAPEQALDSSTVDTRADIYSVGCMIYFLLAGHPPFQQGNAAAKLIAKQTQLPKPIDVLRPDVPAPLAAVVQKMLATRPDDRHPTPAAAADALRPFATPEFGFPGRLFGVQAPDLLTTPPPLGKLAGDDTGGFGSALRTGMATSNSDLHYVMPDDQPSAPRPSAVRPAPAARPQTVRVAAVPESVPPPPVVKAGKKRLPVVEIGLAAAGVVGAAAVWWFTR